MSNDQDDLLLGRLALHYKLVGQEQLAEALRQKAREGGQRGLGEILVAGGLLSPRRLEQLEAARQELLAKRQAAAPGASPPGSAVATPMPRIDTAELPAMPAIATAELPAMATAPTPALAPGAAASSSPGRLELPALLERAVQAGASDVHVHSGAPLRLRRLGQLAEMDDRPLSAAEAERAVREILTAEQQELLDRHGQIDLAYTIPGLARFRVNVYRQQRGLDAVFRVIPSRPPTLAELGLPAALARFADYHQGLVLITGPAGCGKSATLAAMLNLVNEQRRDHIVSIEDPIEVLHPSKLCVVNQRQVGRHTGSFARALRAALREDPDVIAIGELRDLETISLALTAAETGHLVFGTLHTNNAIRTINRILGVFPPSQQEQIRTMISESLRAVISQRLIPRADGSGRVPALEVLVATRAVGNLIRENKTFQIKSILQTGASHGMCLLDASLADLVKAGAITREEAQANADDPARFAAPASGAFAASAPAAGG